MYILTRYKTFKIIRKTQLTLVALLRFCFKIIASKSKMLRLEVVLPVKEPLVATFSKIHAVTSQKDIDEQGMKYSSDFALK